MNRISPLLCSVAILLMAGIGAPYVYAQSAAGSTLMAYKEGVTPEDENADRAACHEWAVTESRFDPKYVYPAFIAYETESRACEVKGSLWLGARQADRRSPEAS